MSNNSVNGTLNNEAIPEGWRADSLGNAVAVNPHRSLIVGKEYPFIPMDALSTDSPRVSYLQKRIWGRSSGSKFQNGDVLVARITPSAENGKTALVDLPGRDGKGFGSTEFIVLATKKEGIEDSRLLYYLAKYGRIRKQAIQRMTGSTGRQRIPAEAFSEIFCLIPPVDEQLKISTMLYTVDEAIQKTNEIIVKTQQLKKGLMQRLLTKGIGHTQFKQAEFGEIPDDWIVARLDDLCQVITKGTTPTTYGFRFVDTGVRFIKVENIDESGNIIPADLTHISQETHIALRRSILQSQDILFSIAGALGRATIVTDEVLPANINQALALIRIKKGAADVHFLYYFLCSEFIQRHVRTIAIQSAQANINLEHVSHFSIRLPPLQEQRKIVEVLSSVDSGIHTEIQRKLRLERLKNGLMQILLTGKVRAKVA